MCLSNLFLKLYEQAPHTTTRHNAPKHQELATDKAWGHGQQTGGRDREFAWGVVERRGKK